MISEGLALCGGFRLPAHLARRLHAYRKRHQHHGLLPFRVTHHPAEPLVVDIVGAQQIAVHDQHATTVHLGHRVLVHQRRAGVGAEAVAEHEVAVPVHHRYRHAGVDDAADRRLQLGAERGRIVIAQPHLEQVAEDVQRVRLAGVAGHEGEELAADVGAARLQMQVADK
jgi:hypothetical protein